MFTNAHQSSGHTETLANGDQAESGAPVLLATPESLKKHDTIDRPLHGRYTENNPVKGALVAEWKAWQWGSARWRDEYERRSWQRDGAAA
jgi:hypothetical protein